MLGFIRYRRKHIVGDNLEKCQLCERDMTPGKMEIHHVIPKSEGGTHDKTFRFCGLCHDALHFFIKIEDIKNYDTIQKIKKEPLLAKYLSWIITKKNNVVYKLKKILKFIQ